MFGDRIFSAYANLIRAHYEPFPVCGCASRASRFGIFRLRRAGGKSNSAAYPRLYLQRLDNPDPVNVRMRNLFRPQDTGEIRTLSSRRFSSACRAATSCGKVRRQRQGIARCDS